MLVALNGDYLATKVKMLLASTTVRACLIGPPEITRLRYVGVKNIVVHDDHALDECVASLIDSNKVHLGNVSSLIAADANLYVVYLSGNSSVADNARQEAAIITASEFAATKARICHVNLSSMDITGEQVALSPAARHLRSLDIARLELDDEIVKNLVRSGRYQNLRWLDLSGNPRITYSAVEAIAASVQLGKLPFLEWLDLLGTDCDATPYVDGCYWRMADPAKQLAQTYGYQPWMMLGSRIPELANKELLTVNQRRTPPNRFSLP